MSGNVQTFLAYAVQSRSGIWDVTCNRCFGAVGSMRLKTLLSAIFESRTKGGVMCPDCRAASCPECGFGGTKGKLCKLCSLDITQAELWADDGPVTVSRLSIYT